ncbi:MAG: acyltransferase family protein [bacterium]|nr:acyltransferase family protein [bacterium]
MLAYAPYYAFGLVAYRSRIVFEGLRAPRAWVLPALFVAVYLSAALPEEAPSLADTAAGAYVRNLVVWLAIAVVLSAFRRFASRPSTTFAYLSEASYTIYLFHHLCVIVLALGLRDAALAPVVKFAIVGGTTCVVTLAVHHFVILRVRFLRFAFNGK